MLLIVELIESMMTCLGGGQWQCVQCGYKSNKTSNIRCHIEAKHVSSTALYQCLQCDRQMNTKNAYTIHMRRYHRQ